MKKLRKYLEKRLDAIDTILEKPAEYFRPETFHKLRVEIKKLDALLRLLNDCAEDFRRKKTFRPFKTVFQQAGEVRECQVEEAMLKKKFSENQLREYRHRLRLKKSENRTRFFSLLTRSLIAGLKKKKQEIITFLKKADEKKTGKYMEKSRRKIKKLLGQNDLQAGQIHELRKALKKFQYSQKSLGREEPKFHPGIDSLTAALGKWHDGQVVTQHLEKALNTPGLSSREISQLEKVRRTIRADNEGLFEKIKKGLQNKTGVIAL